MSDSIYCVVAIERKRVRWMRVEIKSPPFSTAARIEAGYLIGLLQEGMKLAMPHSRPMPSIGSGCHELRIRDRSVDWRVVYYLHAEAVVILDVFKKTTQQTPRSIMDACEQRLREYKAML